MEDENTKKVEEKTPYEKAIERVKSSPLARFQKKVVDPEKPDVFRPLKII